MAFLAGDFRMFPPQRIFRLIVIKPNLLPVVLCMAIRTDLAHPSFVLVVFLVTGVAS